MIQFGRLGVLALGVAAAMAVAADTPATLRDRFGDRLPAGAVARLGTVRFRGQLQIAHDCKSFVTLRDNCATIVDPKSGAEIRQLPGPEPREFEATSFLISPDGQLVAYGGINGVEVWDVGGRRRHRLDFNGSESDPFHPSAAPSLFLKNSSLLVIDRPGGESEITCWNMATGDRVWSFGRQDPTLDQSARTVGRGPNESVVVVQLNAQQSSSVHILVPESGQLTQTIDLSGNQYGEHCSISPDGTMLLVLDEESTLRRIELPSGRELGRLASAPHSSLTAFSSDGERIAVADMTSVRMFNAMDGVELSKRGLIGSIVPRVALLAGLVDPSRMRFRPPLVFSPEQDTVWLVEPPTSAWRLFNTKTGKERKAQDSAHSRRVQFVAPLGDGKQVVTAGIRDFVGIWDSTTGELVRSMRPQKQPVYYYFETEGMAVDRSGKTLAIRTDSDSVQLWDTTTGRQRKLIRVPGQTSSSLAFSGDGKWVAVGPGYSENNATAVIRIYDTSTGKQARQFAANGENTTALHFSPDGHSLVVTATTREGYETTDIFDATTGRLKRSLVNQAEEDAVGVRALAFSPFGGVVVYSRHGEVIVMEIGSGEVRLRMPSPPDETIDLLAVSPDGRFVAGGNHGAETRKILLWDLQTGQPLSPLIGHNNSITALAFLPDGRLVSGSDDTTALVWNITRPSSPIAALATSEDFTAAWKDLASHGSVAHVAIERIVASGPPAVDWLKRMVRPVTPIDAAQMRRLVELLNSEHFAERQKAAAELERLDRQAEPLLRAQLANKTSADARRRITTLLHRLENPSAAPEHLREQRILEILQRINHGSARSFLRELAGGDPAARLTQWAMEALQRSS